MTRFRPVQLPDDCGGLYLHSMPGRYESLGDVWSAIRELSIDRIVCLAPEDELRRKSPTYASALAAHTAPVDVDHFPIADFSGPGDEHAFAASVMATAKHLRTGGRVLIHCGAGIGRTGLYATGVLLALGLPITVAQDLVRKAGSGAEVEAQEDALERLEHALPRRPT